MFNSVKITYRAILFFIAMCIVLSCIGMFIFNVGSGIFNRIKFAFFTYKTIYVVSDLPSNDKVLKFTVEYISRQVLNRYEYKLVSQDECKKIKNCTNKVGIVLSNQPDLVYSFLPKGFLKPNRQMEENIRLNNGSVDRGVMVFRGKKEDIYYYAVGASAPFSFILINMPLSIINIIYNN